MRNRWNPEQARQFSHDELALRAYSSRLLGQDQDLVLHGGGNTSVKLAGRDVFGERQDVLHVKGSGWNLATIQEAGFAPCSLTRLRRLATLDAMSDAEMMRQLRLALLDPGAPTPSVEAILHAIIPLRYVDHTHVDAVVAISNTPQGEAILKNLYGGEVLILPYIMPGFVLARQVYGACRDLDWGAVKGILLLHHGLLTFADDAKTSYDNMIELVSRAEDYLKARGCLDGGAEGRYQATKEDFLSLARQRRAVCSLAGRPMLARWLLDARSIGFAQLPDAGDIAGRGPVTPDHAIHTKTAPAVMGEDPAVDLNRFGRQYLDYFKRHDPGNLTCLDPAPRFAVWLGKGLVCFGPGCKRLEVVQDIARHTIKAIQWGETLGGWRALPEADLFAVEYWELEQAKLKKAGAAPPFEGRTVLVSGAASGIGKACVEEFTGLGACVLALDIDPAIEKLFPPSQVLGAVCDVTDTGAVENAIHAGVARFGGIDVLISNAGAFTPSQGLGEMSDENWRNSLELNLSAHMRLLRAALPYLELGVEPSVVFIASKNVPAPGPGAAAYSTAKAGLTQMARVAALELGAKGIRVNVLHPDGVFDTKVWTSETLEQRAAHYNMSVEEYRRRNVLGMEISSRDVARLARSVASADFARTTGAQIPVDGGNERVI